MIDRIVAYCFRPRMSAAELLFWTLTLTAICLHRKQDAEIFAVLWAVALVASALWEGKYQ